MTTALLIVTAALWLVVLFPGFRVLGTLRALGVSAGGRNMWRRPRPGGSVATPFSRANAPPDFTLPCAHGTDVVRHDFAGRQVLLVFMQSSGSPCQKIIPELNRLGRSGGSQVVVVNNGDPGATRKWSAEVGANFPVLAQDHFGVSRRYEVFATPFACLIDEAGVIASKGIVNNRQHIHFVLAGTRGERTGDAETAAAEGGESNESSPVSTAKEVGHV